MSLRVENITKRFGEKHALRGVTLDVRPPTPRRALLDQRTKEGEHALAFFGMHPSKTPPAAGGILVDAVDPGSRAENLRFIRPPRGKSPIWALR